jgi:hypothetical protein
MISAKVFEDYAKGAKKAVFIRVLSVVLAKYLRCFL